MWALAERVNAMVGERTPCFGETPEYHGPPALADRESAMPMPPPVVADASGFLAVLTISPEMAVVNSFNTAPPTARTRERVAAVFSDVLLRIVQATRAVGGN